MQASDIQQLTTQVLWATLAFTFFFGFIAQRSHFCTMGAISDVVNIGDWTRMRMWAAAVGVALIGFAALSAGGWIDPAKSLYASNRFIWLSALVGGAMFGFGMVLSSGCGSKTLIRIGGGSLRSLVVFIVMGIAAFATLKGVTAVLRVATVDTVAITVPGTGDLPSLASQWFGLESLKARLVLSLVLGLGLLAWAAKDADFRKPVNALGGIGVGLVIVAMWFVSGHLGHVAEHPETLQEAFLATNSGRMESLSFVSPAAYSIDWLMFFSDKSKVLTLGIVSALGVVLGSAVAALASRSFRWEGFGGTEDVANHLAGGVLMGVGGVTAMGCTIGQGLSGISTLSFTSFVAVGAIVDRKSVV